MKKLNSVIFLLVFIVLLTGCVKDQTTPIFFGVEDYVVHIGSDFDVLEDVIAIDDKEGDISERIIVSSNLNVDQLGTYVITYIVQDSSGNETSVDRIIVVASSEDFTFANPLDDLYLSNNNKAFIIAQLEEYYLDNMYGGIPLFEDLYYFGNSYRLDLDTTRKNEEIGLPYMYGSLLDDDTYVQFKESNIDRSNQFTLRLGLLKNSYSFISYDLDNNYSLLSKIHGTLYANTIEDGSFDIVPSLALTDPECMSSDSDECHNNISDTWKIKIKEDLNWSWHEDTDAVFLSSISDTKISASDYVETFNYMSENNLTGKSLGFIGNVLNEHEFTITFDRLMDLNQVKEVFTSIKYTPINFDMLEYAGDDYGNDVTHIAYSGDYIIDEDTSEYMSLLINNQMKQNTQNNYTGIIYYKSDTNEEIINDYLQGYLDYVDYGHTLSVCCTNLITEYSSVTTYNLLLNQTINNPFLNNYNFKKAMYYGLDRNLHTDSIINKNETILYINYNDDIQFIDMITKLTYKNTDLSHEYYVKAVNDLIHEGVLEKGTAENYTVIELNIIFPYFHHDSSENWRIMYIDLINDYEQIFGDENNYVQVKFNPIFLDEDEDYQEIVNELDFEISLVRIGIEDPLEFFTVMNNFNIDNSFIEITYYVEGELNKELWRVEDILAKLKEGEMK